MHTCWIYEGPRFKDGYGKAPGGKLVHREVYEALVGSIPPGLEIDHLCRNRACYNPLCLEPVTHAENMRRSKPWSYQKRKTECPSGHPYAGENLRIAKDGGRECVTCRKASSMKAYRKRQQAGARTGGTCVMTTSNLKQLRS